MRFVLRIIVILALGTAFFGRTPVQASQDLAPSFSPVASVQGDGGLAFSCAVFNGTARCWGNNNYGNLGLGVPFPEAIHVPSPATVFGLENGVKQVATGSNFACAIVKDNTIRCWGNNSYGQLGNGTTTSTTTPVEVVGIDNTIQLSVGNGDAHMCALLASNELKCWGRNAVGQLGNGTLSSATTPQLVVGLSGTIQGVYTGAMHTCAVVDGAAKCWGRGMNGELGNGGTTYSTVPVQVSGLTGNVGQMALGDSSSCALVKGGVQCWGGNSYGQLGIGTTTPSLVPVAISNLYGIVALSSGDNHVCAINSSFFSGNVVQCWGRNNNRQVGSTQSYVTTPRVVEGNLPATGLMLGYEQSCAILPNAAPKCWGRNAAGELGNGSRVSPITTPTDIIKLTPRIAVLDLGMDHSCVTSDQTINRCWGRNLSYQLGDGTNTDSPLPTYPVNLPAAGVYPTAGADHTCLVTTEQRVRCWGHNHHGQIGNGTTTHAPTQVAINIFGQTIVKVTNGFSTTCAVTAAQRLACWGRNSFGQVGNGTTNDQLTPTYAMINDPVADVALGMEHACALLTSGQIKCWGMGLMGQLGNGAFNNSLYPVVASGITNAVEISAGAHHTCARLSNGQVRCWGDNSHGQLGNGTEDHHASPIAVVGLGGATVSIGLGIEHSCAVIANGTAQCWGSNDQGQIGDGTLTNALLPKTLSGISNAQLIDGGYKHTCVARADASVWCWGDNSAGQLGNNTFNDALTPVKAFLAVY